MFCCPARGGGKCGVGVGGVHRWSCFFVQKEVEGNEGVVS